MSLKVIILIFSLFSTPAKAQDFIFFLKNGPEPTPSSTFNNLRADVSILNDELAFTSVLDPTTGEQCYVETTYDGDRGYYKVSFHYDYLSKPIVFLTRNFSNRSSSENDLEIIGSGALYVRKKPSRSFISFMLVDRSDRQVAICRYNNDANL